MTDTYEFLTTLDGPTAEDIAAIEEEAEQLGSAHEF